MCSLLHHAVLNWSILFLLSYVNTYQSCDVITFYGFRSTFYEIKETATNFLLRYTKITISHDLRFKKGRKPQIRISIICILVFMYFLCTDEIFVTEDRDQKKQNYVRMLNNELFSWLVVVDFWKTDQSQRANNFSTFLLPLPWCYRRHLWNSSLGCVCTRVGVRWGRLITLSENQTLTQKES